MSDQPTSGVAGGPAVTAKSREFTQDIERDTQGIRCEACGGYAESMQPSDDEDAQFGCGSRRCCSRAFVCGLCGTRWVGRAPAPEME